MNGPRERLAALIAETLRNACPTDTECLADEDECFRQHSIHESSSYEGRVRSVYMDVDGAAALLANVIANEWANPDAMKVLGPAKLDALMPDGAHVYWSTHCRHGSHDACKAVELAPGIPRRPAQCKTCASACICRCHNDAHA